MADKMRKMLEPRGFRVAQQMEAAREMNLSHDDLRTLARRFPGRYDDLLVAIGASYGAEAKNDARGQSLEAPEPCGHQCPYDCPRCGE